MGGLTGLQFVSNGFEGDVKAAGEQLIGMNPLHTEAIFEMFYSNVGLRQRMPVIAVLDLALWDLVGKIRNAPVYELFGGPVRERVRAYAGMLGFSMDPGAAAEASAEYAGKGFTAMKWYLPYNGSYGDEGIEGNIALIKAVREAVGPNVEIMTDWLLSQPRVNSILWATRMARRLEEFDVTWIEEPFSFDDLDAHRKLSEATSIPLAFGEHFYNRWQMRQVIEQGNPTVVQPDPIWAGGVSEMRKIIAVASMYGVAAVPHGSHAVTRCTSSLPSRSATARLVSGQSGSIRIASISTPTSTSQSTATTSHRQVPDSGMSSTGRRSSGVRNSSARLNDPAASVRLLQWLSCPAR